MKIKLLIILLITHFGLSAQTNWNWANSYGIIATHEYCTSMCSDENGNSYLTGTFQDSLIIGNDTLLNNGGYNSILYLAKFDSSGTPLWAIAPTGSNMTDPNAIKLDENGNIYITGAYRGNIVFGNVSITNNGGWQQAFVAKFDNNGNALWAQTAISNHENASFGLDLNSNNDVYIAGTFDSTITLGGTTLNGTFLGANIFVAKLDNAGNFVWATSTTAGINATCASLTCDQFNNICITGSFRNTITFGAYTLTGSVNGAAGVFTVKYDSNGNVLWAQSSGAFPTSGFGLSTTSDGSGNFYVAGYFNSQIMIFGNDTLTNSGVNDIFLVKYDSLGVLKYAVRAGGSDYDQANFIKADAAGNCYMTGFFKGYIIFGTTTLTGPAQELFVAKYDPSGVPIWAAHATGATNDVGYGLGFDNYNNVYVGGSFSSPITTFGSLSIMNKDQFTGSYDFYLAKLNENTLGTEEINKSGNNISVFPNPSSQNSTITFTNPNHKPATISIYNLQGQLIIHVEKVTADFYEINSHEFSPGLYFVRVDSDGYNSETKFVLGD